MVRSGMSVLRMLANSDTVKVKMCEGDAPTLALIVQSLQTFAGAPAVLEQSIAALGNLCLRLLDNAEACFQRGVLPLIQQAMSRHPLAVGMQRVACLTVRNMVTRSKARVQAAFEEGLEPLLQQAYMRHVICRDVAYACLRDMGCSYAETDIGKAQAERAARAIATGDIAVQ
jgi:hypothetical protein